MNKPWDARIAHWMIAPLKDTFVTPNQLTTVRLLIGLGAVWAFVHAGYAWANLGAWLFAFSNLVDHTDGELARLTGKTSRFGHFYDLACDGVIHVLVFAAMGYALTDSLGPAAPWMGLAAGAAISVIFFLRMQMVERVGKVETALPAAGGFELEDILYLMPLVTLLGGQKYLIIAGAIGTPLFMVGIIRQWLSIMKAPATT